MNSKKILSLDKAARGETRWLPCCWEDCEKTGTTLHRSRYHDHPPALRCDNSLSKHVWYVFCSERHKAMFLNSHKDKGNLPSGSRGTIL